MRESAFGIVSVFCLFQLWTIKDHLRNYIMNIQLNIALVFSGRRSDRELQPGHLLFPGF